MRLLATVLAGSVLSFGAAQASVIYNWQPVSDGPDLETLGGTVEITNAAFASGSLMGEYSLTYSAVPDSTRFADAAVEGVSLQAFFNNNEVGVEQQDFDIFANPTQDQSGNPILYDLEADLSVIDNMLFGNLGLTTNEHSFRMTAGSDGLWAIDLFSSDALVGLPGSGNAGAIGATGRWILDASSIDVPAPVAWPMFALGVLGVFGLARRRAG